MWTPDDTDADADAAEWHLARRRSLRRQLLVIFGLSLGALILTWCGSGVIDSVAAVEREHDRWLEENGCQVTRHRDGRWTYHWFGDYYEHVPGETCYRCEKTGEQFCEAD